jgi:hypothetical protein
VLWSLHYLCFSTILNKTSSKLLFNFLLFLSLLPPQNHSNYLRWLAALRGVSFRLTTAFCKEYSLDKIRRGQPQSSLAEITMQLKSSHLLIWCKERLKNLCNPALNRLVKESTMTAITKTTVLNHLVKRKVGWEEQYSSLAADSGVWVNDLQISDRYCLY